MLPRSPLPALRRLAAGLSLATFILLVPLWLARGVLTPLWPKPVAVALAPGSDDDGSRRTVIESGGEPPRRAVALDYPISLWRIEPVSGEPLHAYVIGVRSLQDDELIQPLPNWLDSVRLDELPRDDVSLVLAPPGSRERKIPASRVARMIRPNRMRALERARLLLVRFRERWRSPLS
jgi:hypothetical protein